MKYLSWKLKTAWSACVCSNFANHSWLQSHQQLQQQQQQQQEEEEDEEENKEKEKEEKGDVTSVVGNDRSLVFGEQNPSSQSVQLWSWQSQANWISLEVDGKFLQL